MKIMGNAVGLTAPRANWAQNDPFKPDYIRNKPDLSGLEAAVAAAAGALSKSGGTMTGDLSMGGHQIGDLKDPTEYDDAATKAYVDAMAGTKRFYLEASLPAGGWMEAEGVFSQNLSVAQILDTDRPHFGLLLTGSRENRIAQQEAFGLVDELETGTGSVTFRCFREKPGVDLNLQLEVSRSSAGALSGGGGEAAAPADLEQAVSMALAQAKESGEFNGVGIHSVRIKEV